MKTVLYTLATLALLGILGAAAVVGFGLYNVSAAAGHLPGVSWVLHTTFRQAVTLRAPPEEEVPELTDALAELGARHFDRACRMCHAAPGERPTATVESMVPEPPPIQVAVGDWSPAELHWIVDEGVKMSGMPHWPSIRDDEVWAVVAFLSRVREMDAASYADVTGGEAYCAGCHGEGGASENPQIPRLDILSEEYVRMSLGAYWEGERESGFMAHAVTEVGAGAFAELAAEYSGDAVGAGASDADPALVETGRELALATTGDPDVPACHACHGPGRAEATAPGPRLDGQHAPYLVRQLHAWRAGVRGGGPRAELMRHAAADLTDADIEALAAWYAAGAPD
ncbi:c-type cytochrome [Wenxinia marina]|uniref:Cytochrome c553 n=1 Tax=Wenxinia marina DSM 24838 TaxID=1123501 RepID=A0A0D0Q911_9RHOB|nr:c-type cytochrome [Wenxinia marina]KIQ68862.1 Cytochrome c553 [Wenxinia marina DSM 24838]GGL64629.1 cytochrome c [Wenxinia marina]